MGKPAFQPGPAFGVQRVHAVNDEFPILKVRHQSPTQQGINVGIDSRQTMEEVHTMDALWSGIRMRRGLWFVFGLKHGAGGILWRFRGTRQRKSFTLPSAFFSFGYPGLNPQTDRDSDLEHVAGVFAHGARPCLHTGEVLPPPCPRLRARLVKVQ